MGESTVDQRRIERWFILVGYNVALSLKFLCKEPCERTRPTDVAHGMLYAHDNLMDCCISIY